MPQPQTYKNHTRFYPLFHFILMPLLLFTLVATIHLTVHDWPHPRGGDIPLVLLAIASLLAAVAARSSALRTQNRTIRLEERIRYTALLSPAEVAAAAALTLNQIIALRFASDAELPSLVARALSQDLAPKKIKESIVAWRPDYDRV